MEFGKGATAWFLGVDSGGEECWGVSIWTDPDPELPGPLSIRKMAVHGAKTAQYPRALHWESKREPWLSRAVGSFFGVANAGSRLSSESALLVTGKDQFWTAPRKAMRSSSRQWGFSLWGVEAALPTIPSALSLPQAVLGQFERKIVDFLLTRHIHNGVCLILKRALGKGLG